MNYLELTRESPAANLAVDEWLLAHCEETGEETLRVWESSVPFVVLGMSNSAGTEADLPACEQLGVPLTRRVSGGGTVVQGPGCLSYALVLRIPGTGPLAAITSTNRHIMAVQAQAIAGLLGKEVTVQGDTDLAVGGRKFSGNSQKRGRRALLFHGTILHAADLELIGRLLRHPSRAPVWRQQRPHTEFVANIRAGRDEISAALRHAWQAGKAADPVPSDQTLSPLLERHLDPSWVYRFP